MSTGGLSGGMPRQLLGLSCLASAIQLLITFLVGKVITRVASFKGDEARDVQLCVTFQNCGPLPLVFADALFSGSLLSDVTACISFYLLAWSPIFWSVGRMILGTYGESDASVSLPKRMVKEIQKFLSPPVVGALLGLVIGSVPFLRQAFFGGWASPLFGALKTLGMAYLPSALLVLAGSLFVKKPPALTNGVEEMTTSPLNGDPARTSSTGPSLKAIVAIMLTRFGIVPLVALTSVRVYDYFGLLGVGRTKAVVSFCLLMQGCMPPAQNSVLLYSLAGLKERASAMAKILALMYSLSVIPVTILLTYCLSVSGIAAFR
jgi:predicted permease